MRIVVIGASQAGMQIARALVKEKIGVTFLERDESMVNYLTERLDCKVVRGDGTNINNLTQAGTAAADFVLVLTQSDEVNLTCCYVISHHFPTVKTVMRLRNIEADTALVIQKTMGSGCLVVNPVREMANAVFNTISTGVSGSLYSFFDDKIQLASLTLDREHPFVGKTIAELRQNSKVPFLIPFLRSQGSATIPSGNTVLLEDDLVYLASNKRDAHYFLGTNLETKARRRVVLLGGNETSVAIVELLRMQNQNSFMRFLQRIFRSTQQKKYDIKIVERDFSKCRELKELLPDIDIVNADITDEGIFQDEHLDQADLLVALTGNSELNIVTSLYAKQQGISQTIVAVRNRNFFNLASQLNLDLLVSAGNTLVNAVLSHIHGREIRRILSIADGSEIDMLEIEVPDDCPAIGKKIKELKLPERTLISFVYRNESAIIPDGDIIIQAGDRLVIITPNKFLEQSRLLFSKVG